MDAVTMLTALMGSALLLMVLSLMYRDNVFYKFAEHGFIGATLGVTLYISVETLRTKGVAPIAAGDYAYVLPFLIGVLLFSRLSKKYYWLARWPTALIAGIGSGLAMTGAIYAMFIDQIVATAKPWASTGLLSSFNNIVLLVAMLSTLSYFFFTFKHQGALGVSAKIGRYAMMIFFGASLGAMVLSNTTFVIGVVNALIQYPAWYMIPVAVVVVVVAELRERSKAKK
jgi:hypothetical protein